MRLPRQSNERPHDSVVRYIRAFDPRLVIMKNPEPTGKWDRWFICEPVMRMDIVDEELKLYKTWKYMYPISNLLSGHEPDQRILRHLYDSRWGNIEHPEKELKAQRKKVIDDFVDKAEAWSKDVGHWHFKRSIDEYNFANEPMIDPTDPIKRREDETGQEYLGDKPFSEPRE